MPALHRAQCKALRHLSHLLPSSSFQQPAWDSAQPHLRPRAPTPPAAGNAVSQLTAESTFRHGPAEGAPEGTPLSGDSLHPLAGQRGAAKAWPQGSMDSITDQLPPPPPQSKTTPQESPTHESQSLSLFLFVCFQRTRPMAGGYDAFL